MRFWDSSALVSLTVTEPNTAQVGTLLDEDPEITVWWASPVECWSALARRRRDGAMDLPGERDARDRLSELAATWTEILPSEELRRLAGSLLLRHPLRAADALQLAAAITAAGVPPRIPIVTLDERLAEAAAREGFPTLP
jgi:predicted nucleic acid-binding protein